MSIASVKQFSSVLILGCLVPLQSLAADIGLPTPTGIAENVNKRPAILVSCVDGLVNAEITRASVGQVLQTLRLKCGLQTNIIDPEITTSRIGIKLNWVSVQEALRAILEGFSYAIYPTEDTLAVSLLSTPPRPGPKSSKPIPGSPVWSSVSTVDDPGLPYVSSYSPLLAEFENANEHEPREDEPRSLDEFQIIEHEQNSEESFEDDEDAQFHDPSSESELQQRSIESLVNRALAAIESDYMHLKQEAINQLASLEDPTAVEILISAANGSLNLDNDSRVEAVAALWRSATDSQFRDIDSANALKQLVSDPDIRVSEIAKQAVQNMGSLESN